MAFRYIMPAPPPPPPIGFFGSALICVYVCMYACLYVCMHVCVCVFLCMFVCVCVCLYVCMLISVFFYIVWCSITINKNVLSVLLSKTFPFFLALRCYLNTSASHTVAGVCFVPACHETFFRCTPHDSPHRRLFWCHGNRISPAHRPERLFCLVANTALLLAQIIFIASIFLCLTKWVTDEYHWGFRQSAEQTSVFSSLVSSGCVTR